MHSFLAGFMGLFMSMGAFFHGGASFHNPANQPQPAQQVNVTGTPSGMMRFGFRRNPPQGERPFFGIVTNISGSTLTIQMQNRMGMGAEQNNIAQSLIITL